MRIGSLVTALTSTLCVVTITAWLTKPPVDTVNSLQVLQGQTMGTTYSLQLASNSALSATQMVHLKHKFQHTLEILNDHMSTYRENSIISRFNQHKNAHGFPISQHMANVVKRGLEISRMTQGAFDITLHTAIDAWGFDASEPHADIPAAHTVQQIKKTAGKNSIQLQGLMLSKPFAHVRINLSGIAKGYGVDVLYDTARQQGIESFLVEIGGEVRVKGTNTLHQAWRIAIEHPDYPSQNTDAPHQTSTPKHIALVQLADGQALATSGLYRNCRTQNNRTVCHILDPRTASPVVSNLVSVSVVAPDCMTADALATASIVMGTKQTTELLKTLPHTHALFITRDPNTKALQLSHTPGFPMLQPK
ncbi:MAG: FAD:protein FMN transferase [Myxococcota bacterium]